MNIDAIATQVKALCPVFAGSVAGAAGYANGVQDQVWLPLPAAYVVPLDQDADENSSMPGLQQIVHERVGVIVVIDTLDAGGQPDPADRRGQAAARSLDVFRAAIFRAILNWRPNEDGGDTVTAPAARGIYYVGGGFPQDGAFDRKRFFYQFSFCLDTTISDNDGWQQPTTPLAQIAGTIELDGTTALPINIPL
jgi:hypothetical protein